MTTDHTPSPGASGGLDTVERAIAEIAAGRAIVVVDDASRENEGDIVFAASKATPELLAFTIRYARGLICVPMLGADLDRLQLPPDDQRQPGAHGHRVHDQRGRARRHHHRDLRGRPGQDHPHRGRLGHRALRDRPARARVPAALRGRRRAAPRRAHRGRRGPGPAGGPEPGRRGGRDLQRRRHHGQAAAAARVRRRARARADLHRPADRVPQALGAERPPGGGDPGAEPVRRVARDRLPERGGRHRAPRAGPRRRQRAGRRTSWSGCTRSA